MIQTAVSSDMARSSTRIIKAMLPPGFWKAHSKENLRYDIMFPACLGRRRRKKLIFIKTTKKKK